MSEKIMFVGDSLTEWFKELNEISNVLNFGIVGNKTNEIIGRLENIVRERPDKVFLMVGINDFFTNKGKWGGELRTPLLESYNVMLKILKMSLPNTTFYIQAILPVSESELAASDEVVSFNQEIDQLNIEIEKLAKDFNMNFLNFTKDFKDIDGTLKKEYTIDGTHLSESAYKLLSSLLDEFIK